MANGVLHIPGFIHFGEGAFSKLSELKGKKAIIVTGGNSMKKNGFVDRACEELKKANMEVCVFDGVEENPSVTTVEAGAKKMQEFQPDWIVALGGGSAMDAAKC
ncbi:iron-containing alcohol dehydrogenase, partial [Bacteroides ovatus]